MKDFRIIEKIREGLMPISYLCQVYKDHYSVYFKTSDDPELKGQYIGKRIKETKRGWTIETLWLTGKPVKLFLPRESFEKVEI